MNSRYSIATALAAAASCATGSTFAQENDDAHHQIDEIVVTAAPLSRTVEQLAHLPASLRTLEPANEYPVQIAPALHELAQQVDEGSR